MIFKERSLTFREFARGESVPLAQIQEFVLQFLCDRDDAAVFGAQAVNAYVDEPRMSQLTFPDLKVTNGAVFDALRVSGADEETIIAWNELVKQEIETDDDEY